ncbi:acyl-CoA thioesterase [Shewanella algae]|uniref:acyl-CoA thioesterase n=1 Tax=Shewanella algae TaxID=38313 RepID=UPI000D13CFF2|nr:thioesterase family protein [Shewanella algae]EKT4487934.1 acyl-CoA thioesterase [Shewanella algae]MBC8794879.1 acyl-CoA thioesterase [Shewanella algae]MBO2550237.1 acyl-CoA thioesterase [Shewanella algae]MBO2571495.1 acyl-CoA thioesterase [Shewanella algae]MBO2614103.1 acyl-CoA thioesterase [Shewanella algae]
MEALSLDIQPRFNETDGLGHINNTVLPVWFEAAREPVFEIFNPGLDLTNWNLIVAGFTIAFKAPTYYGKTVKVLTSVSRIGNSSFEVLQQSWQGELLTAEAKTTLVHYDYSCEQSRPIPDEIRQRLQPLLRE